MTLQELEKLARQETIRYLEQQFGVGNVTPRMIDANLPRIRKQLAAKHGVELPTEVTRVCPPAIVVHLT